jgi:hypothetical protein
MKLENAIVGIFIFRDAFATSRRECSANKPKMSRVQKPMKMIRADSFLNKEDCNVEQQTIAGDQAQSWTYRCPSCSILSSSTGLATHSTQPASKALLILSPSQWADIATTGTFER